MIRHWWKKEVDRLQTKNIDFTYSKVYSFILGGEGVSRGK